MNIFCLTQKQLAALAVAVLATTVAPSFAATLNVPSGTYPTIAAALAAANTGDDIRVDNTFTETTTGNAVSGKTLTITSYDPTFTTPTAGAKWVLATGGSTATGGLIQLSASTLTFSGFSQVTVPGGNAFYLTGTANLTVNNTTFSGITLSNTAGICTANNSVDNVITVNGCTFSTNGRGIYVNNGTTTTSLTVNQSVFNLNTSNPIEFRVQAGTHTFNMSRTSITQATSSTTRVYCFGATSGTTITTANIDRCIFTPTGTGSNLLAISGTSVGVSGASSATLNVTNSIFDLRNAATAATGVIHLDNAAGARTANVNVKHTTVVLGNAGQSAFYGGLATAGAFTIENCVVDGPGTAIKNAATATTTITSSSKDLYNVGTVSSGPGITLGGAEITGTAPGFVNSAGGDFHITAGGVAINAGGASAVSVDYDGLPRPVNAPDLGAYEYQVPTAVNDWTMY